MSAPSSPLFRVQDVPRAGRGVVATQRIPKDTLVLLSDPPAAHVVFRQYRKEVCAQCFHYDRGRTLPVRDSGGGRATGKVFCSVDCQAEWMKEQGELGVDAWQDLQMFVSTKSKAIVHGSSGLSNGSEDGGKPGLETIVAKWDAAEEIAQLHRHGRCSTAANSGPGIKAEKSYRQALHQTWTQTLHPDILGYFLDGVLFHHRHTDLWNSEIRSLAVDNEPYASVRELEVHVNAFLQLTAVAPRELLPCLTPRICHTLVAVASRNAFGIRAGGEDTEEYMGYALHPDGSYFNHSCRPNVGKKRVGRRWEFRTLEDIDEGRECCITYLGGDEKDLDVDARRSRLGSVWGFDCMCEQCRLESGA